MHSVHGFACALRYFLTLAAPVLARPVSSHAPALKAPHEAGRRGGDSIARHRLLAFILYIFSETAKQTKKL
ncbi:hypothetical protein CPU03_11645 [Edwardsiella tarda]|nr:hypothetical protein CPU03_11645 [Edwardsiella tarda]